MPDDNDNVRPILFPRDIVDDLLPRLASNTWKSLLELEKDPAQQEHAARMRRSLETFRPLPSRDTLVRLLDTAYVASFLEEEGAFAFTW